MTEIEKIALWLGLISSIISIVLSIVAIIFARMVDKSARDVTAQTIKSLQKIESDVERLSSDTTGLIKAGWDRMLGNVGVLPVNSANESAKEIASGLLAELRAGLGIMETEPNEGNVATSEQGEKLDAAFENMQNSLEAQLRTQKSSGRPSEALDHASALLNSLSPEAKALASVLARNGYHLTFDQFQSLLRESQLSEAASELRDSGLLVPLTGKSKKSRKPIPVYYFPPSLSDAIRAAFLLLPDMPNELMAQAVSELQIVGYNLR